MYQIANFLQNDDVNIIAQRGAFSVIEWKRDLSVNPYTAQTAYFASEMNVRRRQVMCSLGQSPPAPAIMTRRPRPAARCP